MFRWLSRNKKWLFSGVGVAAVASTISWLWGESESPSQATTDISTNGSSVIINVPGDSGGISVNHALRNAAHIQQSNFPVGIFEKRIDSAQIKVNLKSTQTGFEKVFFLFPDAKFTSLYSTFIREFGALEKVDIGSASPLDVYWALVDTRLEQEYESLSLSKRYNIRLFLRDSSGTVRNEKRLDGKTLSDLKFPKEIAFHMYALPGLREKESKLQMMLEHFFE